MTEQDSPGQADPFWGEGEGRRGCSENKTPGGEGKRREACSTWVANAAKPKKYFSYIGVYISAGGRFLVMIIKKSTSIYYKIKKHVFSFTIIENIFTLDCYTFLANI